MTFPWFHRLARQYAPPFAQGERRLPDRLGSASAFGRRPQSNRWLLCLVLSLCVFASPAKAEYIITDLGTLGGNQSVANGINNSGQIVGDAATANVLNHAFLYSNGQMMDLGTLGGSQSFANAINDAGQIAGYSNTTNGPTHAFLYSNGTMMDFGTLGGLISQAFGINNLGQVVGESNTAIGFQHAFLSSDGTMTDLNSLLPAGSDFTDLTEADAINDNGQIVGVGLTTNGQQHAYLLTPEATVVSEPGTITLLVSGLLSLVGCGWRRWRREQAMVV